MSAKYKSPSFLLPNEINTNTNPLNTDGNSATGTGINSLYSMDFNGTDEYINVGYSLNGIDSITYSVWIKPEQPSGNYGYILTAGDYSTTDRMLSLGVSSGQYSTGPAARELFVFGGQGAGGLNVGRLNYYVTYGTWYHIAIVYTNNQDVDLYVNGNAEGSIQFNDTSSIAAGSPTRIGVYSGTLGNYFKGQIDEVAIFNRALNTTEIAALYEGTSPNIYPSNLIATNLNPIVYYPLGEQAQNSGYPNNPTPANNVWQFPNGVLQDYVMDFDGTSPGDAITSNTSGITGNAARTVSFWYNISTSSSAMIPFSLGGINDTNSNSQFAYCINRMGNSTYAAIFGRGGNDISPITVPATNDSKWHNVIITYTGSTLALYIDGSNITLPSQPSSYATTDGFKIGGWSEAGNRLFDGQLSNIAIWNTDQSANIANIYNNGSPQTTYTVTPQNWWKLNADSIFAPSAPNYTTALDFTSPDLISINSPITIDTTQPYSISAWVHLDSTGNQTIIAGNTSGGSSDYVVPLIFKDVSGSFAAIATHQENSSGVFRQSNNIAKSELTSGWSHIVLVKDGVNCSFFYNGQPYGTASFSTTPPATIELTTIGKGFNNWYLNGRLSNLAIFDSGLTASQVSTLFNFGTPETNISFSPTAWWKLDDQTAITDSSNNGHTGNNNGATNYSSGVAVTPVWKIPSALPITTTPNYTTALKFTRTSDPNSQYINFGTISSMNSGNLSVSLWVYIDNNDYNFIFESNNGGGTIAGISCALFSTTHSTYPNGLFFNRTTTDGKQTSIWPPEDLNVKRNKWQHLAFVFDNSQIQTKFYLNSKLVKTINGSSGHTISPTQDLILGRQLPRVGTNLDFNGNMSNFAIFNSILIESQIETLYNNGTPETAISFSPTNWWKLNTGGSTITDYGSGGNNGTNNGPATQVTSDVLTPQPVNGVSTTLPSTALQQSDLQFDSPYSNYSLSFNGTGDYITVPNDSSLDFGTNTDFTLSMWIKRSSTIGTLQMLMINGDTNGAFWWRFETNNTIRFFLDYGPSIFDDVQTTATITDSNWHHLVAVADRDTQLSMYIDGQLSASNPVSLSGSISTTLDLIIGSTGGTFNGKIDETSIFNYALSSAQILEIYNNGRPKDLSTFSGTAPVSWWRLGENAYFDNNSFIVPNSIAGAPNGTGAGTVTSMLSADAPGTYANGIGDGLAITDRVGDAPLSVANSQSYNMIPDDKVPYVPGYVGNQISNTYSMTFDGVDEYIDLGNSTQVQPVKEMSISAWINASSLATYSGIVSATYNGQSYDGFSLRLAASVSNKVEFYVKTNVYGIPISTTTININEWYHLAGTYDGVNAKLYVNGTLEDTVSLTGNIDYTDGSRNTIIGSLYPNVLEFTGKIDEVAIWNTALTADQVKFDLYKPSLPLGNNQTADIANNPNLPTPVAWYRMGD